MFWVDDDLVRRIAARMRKSDAKNVRDELRVNLGVFSAARAWEHDHKSEGRATDAVTVVDDALTSLAESDV